VTRLDELAKNVPPPRDLWPAIAQSIKNEAIENEAIENESIEAGNSAARAPAPAGRRRGWWMPAVGMAAAVALVSLGVVIGQRFGGTVTLATNQTSGTHLAGEIGVIPAALREANYRQQRDALLVQVNNRLKTMPEEERAKVAASLKTLQRSISDIEAALGKDPANALLQELLVNSCQEEMRALTAVRDSGSQET
jgi:hypothetical protein